MRVTLLFGFLGAGKTTLLTRLLEASPDDEKLAVIVNEFSSVGVDGAILEGRAIDTVELASGCICCSLKGALVDAIDELREEVPPDRLVIEASGVAVPGELLEALAPPGETTVTLGPTVTVVDAARFSVMRASLGPFYGDQVAAADIVVVNKVDLVDGQQCAVVRDEIAAIAPHATILFAERGDIEPGLVLDGVARPSEVAHPGTPHGHVAAESLVLDVPWAVSAQVARRFFSDLPATVWRAKGFLAIDGETTLVQHVPGQTELTMVPARDRHYLVFVGAELDETVLAAGLEWPGVGGA